jgi:uncharacterized membrane protein YoaK (UPF0700 family)
MIHIENVSDVFKNQYIPVWLVSAFKAGFINSAGFLITGKFVSHITGFGTHAGIAIGHEDFFFGAEILFIPVFFILGGIVTYFQVQALITFMIAVVILAGELGLKKGISFDADNNYNLLEFFICSTLCFVCGLKNGLITWATYGKVRVSHLTGTATDIGLNFIRSFNKNQPAPRFKENKKVNGVRIMILLSFILGAVISAVTIPMIGYKGFLIVLAISVLMTMISLKDYLKQTSKIDGALLSR